MLRRQDIIGQQDLLNRIDALVDNNQFPKFTIIVGLSQSGKKLIANYIADKLNSIFIPSNIKIDDIRNTIQLMYVLIISGIDM